MDDYHHSTTCRRNNPIPANGRFGAVNGSKSSVNGRFSMTFGRPARLPDPHSHSSFSMYRIGYNMQDLAYSILSICCNLSIENVFSFRFQDCVNVYSGARAPKKNPGRCNSPLYGTFEISI